MLGTEYEQDRGDTVTGKPGDHRAGLEMMMCGQGAGWR